MMDGRVEIAASDVSGEHGHRGRVGPEDDRCGRGAARDAGPAPPPSVVVVLYVVKFMKYQYLWNRSLDFKNSKSLKCL